MRKWGVVAWAVFLTFLDGAISYAIGSLFLSSYNRDRVFSTDLFSESASGNFSAVFIVGLTLCLVHVGIVENLLPIQKSIKSSNIYAFLAISLASFPSVIIGCIAGIVFGLVAGFCLPTTPIQIHGSETYNGPILSGVIAHFGGYSIGVVMMIIMCSMIQASLSRTQDHRLVPASFLANCIAAGLCGVIAAALKFFPEYFRVFPDMPMYIAAFLIGIPLSTRFLIRHLKPPEKS
jgi:hypothetical protein